MRHRKPNRRLWAAVTIMLVVLIGLAYFSDFLTGRVHREVQDPYTRLVVNSGTRYGFPYSFQVPNEMSDYYLRELDPNHKPEWLPGYNTFMVRPFTFRVVYDPRPLNPPAILLVNPKMELAFLKALPNKKIQFAVVRSLWHPRKRGQDPETDAINSRFADMERRRCTCILGWEKFDRHDSTVTPMQWWHRFAYIFGLTPEGDPLPPGPAGSEQTSGQDTAAVRTDTSRGPHQGRSLE